MCYSIQKSSSTISGVFNVKNIGFIKIFAVGSTNSAILEYPDSANRWVYYGNPSRYTISNNCLYPGTGANQEPLSSRFAFSTDILKVLNLAENDSLNYSSEHNSTIPAFTPNEPGDPNDPISRVMIPFSKTTNSGQSIVLEENEKIIVPLFMGVNENGQKQYFINHKNHLEKGFRGIIVNAQQIAAVSSPMWKYTIELGESSFCAGQDNFPECLGRWGSPGLTGYSVKNLNKDIVQVYAYNLYETSVMPSYGIKITGLIVPIPATVSNVVLNGFKLLNAPDFYSGHVPEGTMVDVRIDRFGRFYFAAPNAVVGGCVAPETGTL